MQLIFCFSAFLAFLIISSLAISNFLTSLAIIVMLAPNCAASIAAALPIPLDPPVIWELITILKLKTGYC